MSQSIQDMIDELERKEFDDWFHEKWKTSNIASDQSVYTMQFEAWKARGSKVPRCRGVSRAGCEYLTACGYLCNKCGHTH